MSFLPGAQPSRTELLGPPGAAQGRRRGTLVRRNLGAAARGRRGGAGWGGPRGAGAGEGRNRDWDRDRGWERELSRERPRGPGQAEMYAGLQELGVANGEDLKETLTNCTEPLKAIEQFQVRWAPRRYRVGPGCAGTCAGAAPSTVWVFPRFICYPECRSQFPLRVVLQTENGVLLPSLQYALPFLDLHGTPRLEFHQSVFDELREKLLERVSAIALEGKVEERSVSSLLGSLE